MGKRGFLRIRFIFVILVFLLQVGCAELIVGGVLVGSGVIGYYAHDKGWLKMEKKEGEEKEERAEAPKEAPKEKKTRREIGCILPF